MIIIFSLTGNYLYTFVKDEVSFENEVKVIGLDYAKYLTAMVDNEPNFTARELNRSEQEVIKKEKKLQILTESPDLFKSYDEETGKLEKFKPEELRINSDPKFFFPGENIKDLLSDRSKYVSVVFDIRWKDFSCMLVVIFFNTKVICYFICNPFIIFQPQYDTMYSL